jgi:hypothetical protein
MEKILIFGTGGSAEKFYTLIGDNKYQIVGFLDSNIDKCGRCFHNHMIYSQDMINGLVYDKIIICSVAYTIIRDRLISEYSVPKEKIENGFYFNKCNLLDYYRNHNYLDEEIQQVIINIEKQPLENFNYDFADKYKTVSIEVFKDNDTGLFYIKYENKRMYMKRNYDTAEKVIGYCRQILMEQDSESPHRYLDDNFYVMEHDIVIDAGVAEGNFALDIIDRADKVYLVEPDTDWIEALKYTFAPYKDKVVFVDKFLADDVNEISTTIDEIIRDSEVDFIKMDIEGSEIKALKGAEKTLLNNSPRLALCVYHNENDEKDIKSISESYGYHFNSTKGYMVFITGENWNNRLEPKKLVRGVLRGRKGDL